MPKRRTKSDSVKVSYRLPRHIHDIIAELSHRTAWPEPKALRVLIEAGALFTARKSPRSSHLPEMIAAAETIAEAQGKADKLLADARAKARTILPKPKAPDSHPL